MKYQRPGYTESTLLLAKYLQDIDEDKYKTIYEKAFSKFINWLYTTSGFYDTKINGSFFNYDSRQILNSDCFIKFLNIYEKSIFKSDKLNFLIHKIVENEAINNYIGKLKPISMDEFWFNYRKWYGILENKKILLINSFAPLMIEQYENGNLHKIDNNFPRLADIISYRTKYTFFNTGPDSNYFETLYSILNDIRKIEFDIALVSCGAYACPIVESISDNKLAISMGNRLSYMFGIDPGKERREFWITEIPTEYIPNDCNKIEAGRYWYGKNR